MMARQRLSASSLPSVFAVLRRPTAGQRDNKKINKRRTRSERKKRPRQSHAAHIDAALYGFVGKPPERSLRRIARSEQYSMMRAP